MQDAPLCGVAEWSAQLVRYCVKKTYTIFGVHMTGVKKKKKKKKKKR